MASTPRITNYDEVLGLPGFLEKNLITPENFDSVFSDYQIRDRDMHCCLLSDRGLCNHKHNFGYVIQLKDGTLSIMGAMTVRKKNLARMEVLFKELIFMKILKKLRKN